MPDTNKSEDIRFTPGAITKVIDKLASVKGPLTFTATRDAVINETLSFLIGLKCMSEILFVLRDGQKEARADKEDK